MTVEAIDAEFRPLAVVAERPAAFLDVLRPKDRIAMATEIADAIKDVIVQRGWLKHIGESDHVYVEGWQFVASLAGASCKVISSEPLADGKGWQARAVVVRIDSGIEIGAGSGMCSRDERTWARREDYALRAMSETRAMSRALRGVFSFIVELAGYRATPAEEMPDHDTAPLPRSRPAAPAPVARPALIHATKAQTQELLDLSKSLGIEPLGEWIATHVAADFPDRSPRLLTRDEAAKAKALLEALIPDATEIQGEVQRMDVRTNGRLFAMLSERGMNEKQQRIDWAYSEGVTVLSFSQLSEEQGRALIRKLELIPVPMDPDDLADLAAQHDRSGR